MISLVSILTPSIYYISHNFVLKQKTEKLGEKGHLMIPLEQQKLLEERMRSSSVFPRPSARGAVSARPELQFPAARAADEGVRNSGREARSPGPTGPLLRGSGLQPILPPVAEAAAGSWKTQGRR